MPITYHVAVDWDDDGDFSDPGEDISADVLALRWRLGMSAAFDTVAAPSAARITVRNTGRAYSPEASAHAIRPGKVVRIQTDDGDTLRTQFTGFLAWIEPEPGEQGARRAVLHVRGPEAALGRHPIRLPPQVGVRADDVIAAALDRTPLRRPVLKTYLVLDVPGHAELDSKTRLSGETIARSLEEGISTFAYAADTWGDGIPALAAIRALAEAERGRFFVNRDGEARFYNRHHTLLDTTSQAAFEDTMDGVDYAYGLDLVNRVDIAVTPRAIGIANSVLWRLASALPLLPGESGVQRPTVRFVDAENRPCAALDITPPVPGVDYFANTADDGSGTDVTDVVDVRLLEPAFSAATLELRNRHRDPVYLLAGMQLRGTPLHLGEPMTVSAHDYASQTFHGEHRLALNLPEMDSLDHADQLARFELARRAEPRGVVATLTLDARRHAPHALERTLFDRVTVRETQTGHEADYFIVAEHHDVDLGGARHRVVWTLESAHASAFWIVGVSPLEATTILAY